MQAAHADKIEALSLKLYRLSLVANGLHDGMLQLLEADTEHGPAIEHAWAALGLLTDDLREASEGVERLGATLGTTPARIGRGAVVLRLVPAVGLVADVAPELLPA
jgi:hypothetical protein